MKYWLQLLALIGDQPVSYVYNICFVQLEHTIHLQSHSQVLVHLIQETLELLACLAS